MKKVFMPVLALLLVFMLATPALAASVYYDFIFEKTDASPQYTAAKEKGNTLNYATISVTGAAYFDGVCETFVVRAKGTEAISKTRSFTFDDCIFTREQLNYKKTETIKETNKLRYRGKLSKVQLSAVSGKWKP